jgi:phosphoribosylglycinamide formyltransferase 1
MNGKIGLITYSVPHSKTDLCITGLLSKYDPMQLKIFSLPFIPRPERKVLFQHRPEQSCAANPVDYHSVYHIGYQKCDSDTEITNDCDIYLILCGKLISAEVIHGKKIINIHPGAIPSVRGLDAFKWAILEMQPLGITMHFIDERIDEGEIISIVKTPVLPSDTLESLAVRHYQNELLATINFENYLNDPVFEIQNLQSRPVARRMPFEKEKEMAATFESYKKRFAHP